jgi:hypothetical protein
LQTEFTTVRGIQRCQNLRLALKARHAIEVLSERIRKNFDGDVSPQFRVGGAKNRAHPTFAQFGGDPVSERSPIQSTSSPSYPFHPLHRRPTILQSLPFHNFFLNALNTILRQQPESNSSGC